MPEKLHPPDKKKHHHKPGPKERELATQLTIAILHAARPQETSVDALSDRVAGIYRKMLALVESDPQALEVEALAV